MPIAYFLSQNDRDTEGWALLYRDGLYELDIYQSLRFYFHLAIYAWK